MKFAIAIFAVLAIAGPLNAYKLPSTGSGQLANDLQGIADMMPIEEIFGILRAYLAQDKEMQSMATIVESPHSKEFTLYVENAPIFKKLAAFVQENGLDIYYLINKYNQFAGVSRIVPLAAFERQITGGLDGFIEDVASVVPLTEMMDVLQKKIESSKTLSKLVALASSNENAEFVNSWTSNPSFLKLKRQAEQLGVSEKFDSYYVPFLMFIPVAQSTF